MVTEKARIVIGADGLRAHWSHAASRRILTMRGPLSPVLFIPTGMMFLLRGVELYPRPERMIIAGPAE